MDRSELQAAVAAQSWFHTIDLGNGVVTPGRDESARKLGWIRLPDLRGRAPVHPGQGPGLTPRVLGEQAGSELVTLIGNQLPTHTHQARAATADGTRNSPAGGYWAPWSDTPYAAGAVTRVAMHPAAVNPVPGSGQPHENRSPFLAVGFAIALAGVFPSFE